MTDPFVPPRREPPPPPQPWTQPTPGPPPAWAQPTPGPPPAWAQQSPPDWQTQQYWGQQAGQWPPHPGAWPQQGQWHLYDGGPPPSTNGLAVASLVTALTLPLPVGLGLGIAALRQIRRRGESGRGLAVAGIVVSSVVSAILTVVILAAVLTSGFAYSREGNLADIASTQVGTCLDLHPSRVTDCSAPHEREVYFNAAVPRAGWPGEGSIDDLADDICLEAFDDYVGMSFWDSDYDYAFYAPSESEWRAGSHRLVCVITPAGEFLVGSVKGSRS